ncbi:LLM class flavin-dependent oxidoreductase [Actinosynnema sp. NPDC020468]|uniref:LLM class flavin-dependent oxidoreductase n=1 Tax=Actinosynnema sp. NPDC020468 TaxID=3154488 RepID=UPI00340034D0
MEGFPDIAVNISARSVREAIAWGAAVESAGVARLGVWDSPVVVPECWTLLGALSQHVSAVPLGVTVTNPVTRHPVVTASALAALAEVSAGGVFLGVGTGDSGVYNLAGRASTLAGLREYVTCVRELLAEGRSRWRGGEVFLDRPPAARVPVLVAAHGLRSLAVAAEIGDGVIVGLGHSADVVAEVERVVHRVCAEVGREAPELWWNTGSVAVDEDPERAVAASGWIVAAHAHHFARFGMRGKAVPAEYRDGVEELGRRYDLTRHGRQSEEGRRRYVESAVELGVWEYLRDRFVVAGTEAEVRDRLRELWARGVRRVEMGTSAGGVEAVLPVLAVARG